MNDCDLRLLDLAAKAYGLEFDKMVPEVYWNPLDDNNQAMRLMTYLRMSVDVSDDDGGCTYGYIRSRDILVKEIHNDCSEYATRRAITGAAALFGKTISINNLKKCPFCDNEEVFINHDSAEPGNFHKASVVCSDCQAAGPSSLSVDGGEWVDSKDDAKDRAINAWNQRVTNA